MPLDGSHVVVQIAVVGVEHHRRQLGRVAAVVPGEVGFRVDYERKVLTLQLLMLAVLFLKFVPCVNRRRSVLQLGGVLLKPSLIHKPKELLGFRIGPLLTADMSDHLGSHKGIAHFNSFVHCLTNLKIIRNGLRALV